jgi:uncharacterized YccA/Bax inhibitor family protein
MQSNNPVFSRSEPLARSLQQGVGFHTPAPSADHLSAMYRTPSGMTLDDVIVKTGLMLATMVATGAAAWVLDVGPGVIALAGIAGFVLALVNIFKKQVSPPLVMAYAAAQGVFVGAISHVYADAFGGGIVTQAVLGTTVVFGAVLAGYKSGRLRATPKFQKVVTLGLLGMVGLVVVNLLFGYKSGRLRATPMFRKVVTFGLIGMVAVLLLNLLVGAFTSGDPLGISGGNTGLSILFTLGLIVFGALTFVMDFDQADRMVAAGVPDSEAWRVSFGLVVGLIFLYLNILRLLAYLQSSD